MINENWILKAGIRQDSVDLSVDDYLTLKVCKDVNTCSIPMDVTGGDIDYDTTTFNVGVRYNMNEYFSPFIGFSQGSDISDLGLLLRTATVDNISLIRTEASIVDNYEVGLSGQFADLTYEVAAYRSYSELGTGSQYIVETGVYMPIRESQKIWGYEAQLSYQVQDNLTTSVSYSWIGGKNTETDTYLDGKTISAPKFTTLHWQPIEEVRVGLNYLYVGDRKRFEPVDSIYIGTLGPVSHYNLVNLSSSYQINNWQLSLGIQNLLNKDYYSARSQAYTFPGFNTKGLGTTVNLGVKSSFWFNSWSSIDEGQVFACPSFINWLNK